MNKILTLGQISKSLQDRRLGYISEQIDVSKPTLYALKAGKYQNFKDATLQKVSDYLIESASFVKNI